MRVDNLILFNKHWKRAHKKEFQIGKRTSLTVSILLITRQTKLKSFGKVTLSRCRLVSHSDFSVACLPIRTSSKTKKKWHTLGSAGSPEDLQQSIREHNHNDNLVIEDDGTVVNYETDEVLSSVVRNKKGRW